MRASSYNSNKSPTWCNSFSVYYPDVCLQLSMFRAFSRPSKGTQWLQWQPLVLPAQPRTQHDYHHDTKVEPEAATAVIELLMMGGKAPETCWAVNIRQDNKLKNCCTWLVIYSKWSQYSPDDSWQKVPESQSCYIGWQERQRQVKLRHLVRIYKILSQTIKCSF